MDRQEMKDLYYHHTAQIAKCTSEAADAVWTAQSYFLDFREPISNLIAAEGRLETALDLVRTLMATQAKWDKEKRNV